MELYLSILMQVRRRTKNEDTVFVEVVFCVYMFVNCQYVSTSISLLLWYFSIVLTLCTFILTLCVVFFPKKMNYDK